MTHCTELDRIIKKAIEKGPKKFRDDYESIKSTRDRDGLRGIIDIIRCVVLIL